MDFLYTWAGLRERFVQATWQAWLAIYSCKDQHSWLPPSVIKCLPARHHLSGFDQRATHQIAWLEKKRHSGDMEEAPVPTFGKAITWLAAEMRYTPALPVNGYAVVGNMSFHWACLQVAKSLHLTSNGGWVLPTASQSEKKRLRLRTSPTLLVLWEQGPGKPLLPRKDRRDRVLVPLALLMGLKVSHRCDSAIPLPALAL